MPDKQIFCYTFTGGTAAFFDGMERELPEYAWEKFEYAGHGTRHREPFYRSFDELADDAFSALKAARNGGEYALFGYSMGSISLVEVLRRIIAEGVDLPGHVFLAAHEPHTKAELTGYNAAELDEWVKARTIRFGAVSEKLLNNRTFWRTYLPLYRADYGLISGYRFEALRLSTDVPATVFYSQTDTPIGDMRQWRRYFTGPCDFHCFEGNHFFIRDHQGRMAEIIKDRMDG